MFFGFFLKFYVFYIKNVNVLHFLGLSYRFLKVDPPGGFLKIYEKFYEKIYEKFSAWGVAGISKFQK